jgi:3D (Asp-Asp-Asp) domain-containing protein
MLKPSNLIRTFVLFLTILLTAPLIVEEKEAVFSWAEKPSQNLITQRNTIDGQENTSIYNGENEDENEIVCQKLNVVVTAYSSTVWQTDDTPYITASGAYVREGIVANNLFPLGTKIKIPEIFGDQVFVVEDRMNPKKSYYHIDVWFPSYSEALNFGAKRTYIEVLKTN